MRVVRGIRHGLVAVALMVGLARADAIAQQPTAAYRDSVLAALPAGAYVRALDAAIFDGVNGTVLASSPAALRLRRDDGTEHTILAEHLRGLSQRGAKSRRYGYTTGVARGAVLGIVGGVLVHFAGEWFSDAPFADAGPPVIISATGLGGAALGGAVGAVLGRHRWRALF